MAYAGASIVLKPTLDARGAVHEAFTVQLPGGPGGTAKQGRGAPPSGTGLEPCRVAPPR